MDPVSTAIIAAIAGGATTGIINGLPEAYAALKSLIVRTFGADSTACQAMEKLEAKPSSAGWKEDLADDLDARNAAQAPDIAAAAAKVMEVLNGSEQGRATIQNVTGNYNATAANGSTATVNVTRNRQ